VLLWSKTLAEKAVQGALHPAPQSPNHHLVHWGCDLPLKTELHILPEFAGILCHEACYRSAAGTLIEVLLAVRQLILVRKLLPILLELRSMLAKLPLLLD
jgi:hypothetical protein